jgi:uncharacterized protein YjbJ (UPF0337 family)
MRFATTSAVLLASIAVASCGESSEDKAQTQVCNARADISKQVDQLKGMTAATFTTEAASKSLSAIRSDLQDIKSAQGDLSDDRRQQVQQANQEFSGQVQDVLKQVFRSTSAGEAKSELTSAFQQLADSYKQTYARVDCS